MEFTKIRNYIFLAALLAVTIVAGVILKPFFYPLFWAAIIAAIFYPLYRRLNKKFNHGSLSSIITMIIVLLVFIVPVSIVGTLIISQTIDLYQQINNNSAQINNAFQQATGWLKYSSLTAQLPFDETFWIQKFSDATQVSVNFIFDALKNITQNSLIFIFELFIMFYALFFFLRDGEKLLLKLMHLCPLGDKYEKMLYQKFTSTARATIKGNITVALIQGGLGCLLFAATGVPGAIIWGILMAVFCMIPGLGSAIIWLPTSLIMILTGNIWQGVTILIFGALVISFIDNLLRPMFVGRDTELHPLLVLLSTLGGIFFFGLSGFILGPIIAALLVAFWHMYEEYYKEDLVHN